MSNSTIKGAILNVLNRTGLIKPINRLPGYAAKIAVSELNRHMEIARAEIVDLRRETFALRQELSELINFIDRYVVLNDSTVQPSEKRRHSNSQEFFWSGVQGVAYAKRSEPPEEGYYHDIWKPVLDAASDCSSALELGCNRGGQLRAIHTLKPEIELTGVEINPYAAEEAAKLEYAEIIQKSILDFTPEKQWDLAFTAGVLIHFDPFYLPDAYELINKAARKYAFFYENYSETPVNIDYNGRMDLCWARDFAQDFQDAHPGWSVMIEGVTDPGPKYPPHSRRKWTLLQRTGAAG
ncbi:hypothetical protein L2D14_08000 [Thalassospiraceae bacterium LMO-JJ14]|nr:hypothetical protein L2D14_08000 [Thalassospiraceae bacterium LMO-JJ14]